MADAKVSELVSATSLGGSDQLYVVQSNTSKKITAATLFANAANVVLSGNTTFGGTPQTLGAPGIININTPITQLSADAIGGTLQIPNGASGQVKIVTMTSTAGGSYTFNTSNIAGNVSVTLDSVGDTVVFIFTNGKWFPVTSTSGINLTSISSNVIPSANSVYDLGSATNQWRSLYVSNNTIFIGGTPLTISNGELVIGSGGSSANLATVAFVNAAVANAGGGGGLTSADLTTANVSELTNLYFTNTRAVAAVTNNNITLGNVTSTSLTTTNVIARVGAATGNIVTNVRIWDSAGANLYVWFNAANTPELVTLGNFGNIVGWTVSVSGGNSATVTETNPAGYFSISTSAALTGSGTLTFTSPDYTPLPLNLKADGKTWRFDNTGNLTLPANGDILDSNGISVIGAPTGINSSSDIYITNSQASGPDIYLESGDDIFIRGKDKTVSDSEGGDINIEGGDGGPADSGDPGGSGGDIVLRGGEGGAPSGDYEGGSGGFVLLEAGNGASANIDASITANDGGYIRLVAGDAGFNGGTSTLGATGGYIYLTAGNSTNQNTSGGDVRLTSGQGGPNGYAGNIDLITPESDLGAGGTWRFSADGILTTPGDVNIEGGITLSQTSITGNRDFNVVNINSAPNPNAYVQLNETGDSFFGAESNVLITTGGDFYEWKFGADSILTLPGNLYFSGCSISAINSVSNSSGDGIGASTLQIVPDNALFNNDQYIIIDPTEPDHIHIRGGGAIDNCSAKLIIGGENSHFAVQAGANASVSIRADGQNWNFGTDGILSAPGSISSDGITSTGKSKFDKVIESHTGVVNPTGNVTFNCSSSHIFNVTSINTNFTANITDLDLDDGEATSVTLVLNQGATAYIANALQLSGTTQTIRWQANTVPTGNVNAVDVQTFSILNVNGNYTVLGQLTTFG